MHVHGTTDAHRGTRKEGNTNRCYTPRHTSLNSSKLLVLLLRTSIACNFIVHKSNTLTMKFNGNVNQFQTDDTREKRIPFMAASSAILLLCTSFISCSACFFLASFLSNQATLSSISFSSFSRFCSSSFLFTSSLWACQQGIMARMC